MADRQTYIRADHNTSFTAQTQCT